MEPKEEFNRSKKEYIHQLLESKYASLKQFEKYLLYLSSGVFIITAFFLEKLVPLKYSSNRVFLILTWVFIGLCLVFTMISNLVSSFYINKTIKDVTDYDGEQEKYDQIRGSIEDRNKKTFQWNVFLLVLFIIGIIFLVLYVMQNLPAQSKPRL